MDSVSRNSAGFPSEEVIERFNQSKRSPEFFWMVLLMALSLIPAFIMLGGFKFVVYLAVDEEDWAHDGTLDKKLTALGMGGALLLFFGRHCFAWLAQKNLLEPETLLRAALGL